jgi:hypothetical protein
MHGCGGGFHYFGAPTFGKPFSETRFSETLRVTVSQKRINHSKTHAHCTHEVMLVHVTKKQKTCFKNFESKVTLFRDNNNHTHTRWCGGGGVVPLSSFNLQI